MSESFSNQRTWRAVAATVAFAAVLPVITDSFSTAGVVLIYGIAAAACSLLLGYGGILSFAQGSFFGAGSYTAGMLLKQHPGLGLAALAVSMAIGAVLAGAIGLMSTRQKGIYSVMITLAMAQLVYFAALSFPDLTGGENGLLDIPRVSLGMGAWLNEAQEHYLLVALAFSASVTALGRIATSPFGRVLDAVRENEIRAETLGYHVTLLKLQAFCISGALTGLAGGLYAMQLRSSPLSNIDLATSEAILVMAILGGRRSVLGTAVGAFAMIMMGEFLAELWPRWQMIVGGVLIAVVLFAPDGLGGLWTRWRGASVAPREAAAPQKAEAR